MKKNKIITTRHIKVEIREPTGKELDLQDEFDLQQAKKDIFREWLMIESEVKAFFTIININEKPLKTLLNKEDFP